MRSLVLAAAVLTLPASLAKAQAGGFVVRLGSDTIAVERYERLANRIEGQILRHLPTTSILRYAVTLNADGSVAGYEQSILRPDGSAAPNAPGAQRMRITGDSVFRDIVQNGQPTTLRAAAPRGTVPGIPGSVLGSELVIATAKRLGAAHLIGLAPQQAAPTRLDVRLFGADSAEIVTGGFRQGFRLDKDGHVTRSDGSLTTQKFVGTAGAPPNIGTIASAWAAKDAAGQSLGAASTRDTARAVINGVTLWVDYGRPAARGREIWGKLVPNDTVWRFGANAATQLKTDKDVTIGGLPVPQGTYTLFLYPTATSATLIVNKQTGQWGTAYDAAQDLVRIPLELEMNRAEHEERFRILFEGNAMLVRWARGGYRVKIM
jgi:hypothetical protein